MTKRLIALLLTASMLSALAVEPAMAEFVTTQSGTIYQTADGVATGLTAIGEDYYYFNEAGILQTGPQWWDGEMYYFSMLDGTMQRGWIRTGSLTYYADPETGILYRNRSLGNHYFQSDGTERTSGSGDNNGTAAGGWVQDGGKTYYYGSSGNYVTGLQKIEGNLYFFNAMGVMQKGKWVTYNGKDYYIGKKGIVQTSRWVGKKTYYVTETGEKAKGFQTINGKLYYFDPETGKLRKKGKFKLENGAAYYAGKNGVVFRGRFFKFGNARYYALSDGQLASGLTKVGNDLYFFNRVNHKMLQKVKKQVGNYYYFFQKNGRAARSRWVKINGNYYYFLSNGRMATNQVIDSVWYVDADGVRTKRAASTAAGLTKKNGKYYVYDKEGKMLKSQWATVSGETYYLGSDGAALTGMQTIGDRQYYFDEDCILLKDTIVVVGKTAYVVAEDGHITGTTKVSGDAIATYAQQFVGNPYVYGGTSLTKGADCSGFVYTIFNNFGFKVLRVADDQMKGPSSALQKQGYKKGTVIRDSNLLPGDLVFYGNSKYASHVAIYIGKGKVVHAANSKSGIIISDIDYVKSRVKNKNMRYWA